MKGKYDRLVEWLRDTSNPEFYNDFSGNETTISIDVEIIKSFISELEKEPDSWPIVPTDERMVHGFFPDGKLFRPSLFKRFFKRIFNK